MKKILLVAFFALAACKGATTARPAGSDEEVSAEQQTQQKLAAESANKHKNFLVKANNEMRARLKLVAAKISPAGTALCHDLKKKKCGFGYKLQESGELNAFADGDYIIVSTDMMDFADNDELAVVLSHEYAHSIMGHIETQQDNAIVGGVLGTIADGALATQGVNTGGAIGELAQGYSVMHYSIGFEQEADYVGLYIMARAGYNINEAPKFWRKMSAADSGGIGMSITHPTNPERFVAMTETIKEIKAKQAAHQPLLPEFGAKEQN